MDIPEPLRRALGTASVVTAFTGAGISAESGVATFRSEGGLWKKMKPEELASMYGFIRNPALVWEWYAERKRIIAEVSPNPGHRALAQMQDIFPRFAVITQNIDGLHRRAGSRVVHELHGSIERNYCMQCGATYGNDAVLAMQGIPACPSCKGRIRPDVVWFGEMLPEDEWELSVRASEVADVFLSIGTSSVVYPAASLPVMAKRSGALLVEVNPEPTPLTPGVDVFLQGTAGSILPALYDCAVSERKDRI